eukprot:scaffold278315_cov17-Prasinocladus_malaysianus.AAC.1
MFRRRFLANSRADFLPAGHPKNPRRNHHKRRDCRYITMFLYTNGVFRGQTSSYLGTQQGAPLLVPSYIGLIALGLAEPKDFLMPPGEGGKSPKGSPP